MGDSSESDSVATGAAYVFGFVGLGLGSSAGVIAAILWKLTEKCQLLVFSFGSGISVGLVAALFAVILAKLVIATYGKRKSVRQRLEISPERHSGSEAA